MLLWNIQLRLVRRRRQIRPSLSKGRLDQRTRSEPLEGVERESVRQYTSTKQTTLIIIGFFGFLADAPHLVESKTFCANEGAPTLGSRYRTRADDDGLKTRNERFSHTHVIRQGFWRQIHRSATHPNHLLGFVENHLFSDRVELRVTGCTLGK